MTARRVLLLTAGRLDVYEVTRGVLELRATFSADAVGISTFAASLRAQPRTPVRLVIDVASEEFHVETVPLLRGRERRAVLDRRWRQRFPGASLGLAASLGAVRGERREERVLLGAFTQMQVIQPWVDAIRHVGVPIAGVYSAAQLAAPLLSSLKLAQAGAILVTSGTAGLRQTFVESGRLRLSRLTPATASSPEAGAVNDKERANLYHGETRRLHQYLRTSAGVDASATITAALIVPAATEISADATDPQLHVGIYTVDAVARTLGLQQWPAHAAGDALTAYLAATAAPREQYVDDRLRADTLRRRWRMALAGAGGIAATVFFCAAAGAWFQAERLIDQTEGLRAQMRTAAIAEEEWKAWSLSLPTTTARILAVVKLHRALQRESEPMSALLLQISAALAAVPEIELDSLHWRREPAGPAPSRAAAAETADIAARVAVVPSARGINEGDAAQSVAAFVRALERQPGMAVVETRLPFATSPAERLAGDLRVSAERAVPTFTLRAARRSGA